MGENWDNDVSGGMGGMSINTSTKPAGERLGFGRGGGGFKQASPSSVGGLAAKSSGGGGFLGHLASGRGLKRTPAP